MGIGDLGKIIVGYFLGVVVTVFAVVTTNRSYTTHEERLTRLEKLCSVHNSKPISFDLNGELVCENGLIINYTTGEN